MFFMQFNIYLLFIFIKIVHAMIASKMARRMIHERALKIFTILFLKHFKTFRQKSGIMEVFRSALNNLKKNLHFRLMLLCVTN